ncbi:hypothetical protein E4U17_002766 [Claviceps sp. LM77 group G4]|nr:hypothetical protein E4U17_002766 [Claviceps sp. LM77 group G4]KAG6070657.1 hypothetical protein E4U33_004106 [Claviceps sp. LM78 group G4]KAG6073911.1 hypothetical protein E4U16_004339 [Claviceps sp. LM84 group G4]
MTDSAPSPKRRHILSSINPHKDENGISQKRPRESHGDGSASHHGDSHAGSPGSSRKSDPLAEAIHTADRQSESSRTLPSRSRLRLKSEKSRRRRSSRERHKDPHCEKFPEPNSSSSRHHHRHHRHHHHHSHRRHHSPRRHRHRDRSPTPPNPYDARPLDPEAAFRESLFDAMADDEGASYWESVYGQPIHVYSNEKIGPAGELEQMTEDEYAAYVRQRMWEKTHAGLLEERAKQDERRKKKAEEEQQARKLQREMEQSLRRGEERRQRRRWTKQWEEYSRAWAAWNGTVETLAWPVAAADHGQGGCGGRRVQISEQDVRAFYVRGLDVENVGESAFVSKLKEERVRWHPDKMQQRLGGEVDSELMRDVTAVFQIIDKLWTDVRDRT